MTFDPGISEWGNPAHGDMRHPLVWGHTRGTETSKYTRGTETSKYPQEEKTNVIPQVAASERGGAQTGGLKGRPGL